MLTSDNDTRELALTLANTDLAPELAEFNPSVQLESPVGPFVEYERTDSQSYVDGFIPDGWAANYTDQVKLASGRYRAPLVRDEERVQPLKLEWGAWPVPASAPIAWGARAIYRLDSNDTMRRGGHVVRRAGTRAVIDTLFDRQGLAARGDVKDPAVIAEFRRFTKWLDGIAMPALRKECASRYITPDSSATVEIERDGYKLVAGPRASYGYLYIRAWKVVE